MGTPPWKRAAPTQWCFIFDCGTYWLCHTLLVALGAFQCRADFVSLYFRRMGGQNSGCRCWLVVSELSFSLGLSPSVTSSWIHYLLVTTTEWFALGAKVQCLAKSTFFENFWLRWWNCFPLSVSLCCTMLLQLRQTLQDLRLSAAVWPCPIPVGLFVGTKSTWLCAKIAR